MDSEHAENLVIELREDLRKIYRVHTLLSLRSFSEEYKTVQGLLLKQYIANAVAEIERVNGRLREDKCADVTVDGRTSKR